MPHEMIEEERLEFANEEEEATPILKRIDAHFLLLLTFLIYELTKKNIKPHEIYREVDQMLFDMEWDITDSLYQGIENVVVNSMAEGAFAIASKWTKEEARNYLDGTLPGNLYGDMPRPNYVQQSEQVLKALARKRLDGVITPKDAKEAIISTGLHSQMTRSLYEDTYQDILMATRNTNNRLKKVIRDITMEVLQTDGILAQNNRTIARHLYERISEDSIYKRLSKDGLVGIVDAGGKRWRLDVYTKMVINTKLTDAHLQATKLTAEDTGMDLAVISHNATTVDACLNWEGVVVSVNGNTPGYPVLDDAIATNEVFHPNCRHHLSLIRSIDDLTPAQRAEHEKKLPAVAEPEKRPYRRQRQI